MADTSHRPRELGDRSLFIDGYFSKRIWNGETPVYGYPVNHLPDVGTATTKTVPGFVAALRAGK